MLPTTPAITKLVSDSNNANTTTKTIIQYKQINSTPSVVAGNATTATTTTTTTPKQSVKQNRQQQNLGSSSSNGSNSANVNTNVQVTLRSDGKVI